MSKNVAKAPNNRGSGDGEVASVMLREFRKSRVLGLRKFLDFRILGFRKFRGVRV